MSTSHLSLQKHYITVTINKEEENDYQLQISQQRYLLITKNIHHKENLKTHTSTSSPSLISFFISGGGGNRTSLKGTWRSGCQLKD